MEHGPFQCVLIIHKINDDSIPVRFYFREGVAVFIKNPAFKNPVDVQSHRLIPIQNSYTAGIEPKLVFPSGIFNVLRCDLNFPRDAVVGGIIRGSETFIATGDTRIKPYDRAVIFALPTALSRIEKLFS